MWKSLFRCWVGFTCHCLVVGWFLHVIVLWLTGFDMSLFTGWVVFTCNCFVVEWFLHAIVQWLSGFYMSLFSGWVVFAYLCLGVLWVFHVIVQWLRFFFFLCHWSVVFTYASKPLRWLICPMIPSSVSYILPMSTLTMVFIYAPMSRRAI